jgi:MHS family proline/betaine transporter-like MFS transporter
MPAKLATQPHANRGLMLLLSSIGLTIFPLLIPVFGNLADKIGKIKMLKIGIITYLILAYPAFSLLHSSPPLLILLGYLCFALATAMFVAPLPATIAALFPTNVRCSGTSVGVNISASIFGGTVPLVATWLVAYTKNPNAPIFYLLTSILISVFFVWRLGRMKEYL